MFPFIFLPRHILFYLWDLSFPGICILSLNHAANKTESKPRVWGFQYHWYLMSYCSWKQQEGKLSTNPPQSYSANTELTKPMKVQTIHCAWNKWIPPTPTPSGCFSPLLCHNASRSLSVLSLPFSCWLSSAFAYLALRRDYLRSFLSILADSG